MKKITIVLMSLFFVNLFIVKADSWRVYNRDFSFADNDMNVKETLPGTELVKVLPLSNGKILGSDLMYKKENETIQVYSEEVPFSLKPIIRMVYYYNNEFLFHITRNPSINVKSKSTSNSPQADFVKEYANRINTFDKDIIYIMKTK